MITTPRTPLPTVSMTPRISLPTASTTHGIPLPTVSMPPVSLLPVTPVPLPAELKLMFSLLDRVPGEVAPMLAELEEHIVNAGLADMLASADSITQVSTTCPYKSLLPIFVCLSPGF